MKEADRQPKFFIGEQVLKVGGGYGGPGLVKSVFQMSPGVWRYNIAHKIEGGYGMFIHIYSDAQLESFEARKE